MAIITNLHYFTQEQIGQKSFIGYVSKKDKKVSKDFPTKRSARIFVKTMTGIEFDEDESKCLIDMIDSSSLEEYNSMLEDLFEEIEEMTSEAKREFERIQNQYRDDY